LLPFLAHILLIFIIFPSFSEKNSAFANQHLPQDSAIQKLQEDSQNKIDTLLKDKEFQDIVSTLEAKASCSATNLSFGTSSKDANSVSKSCQMENEFEHLRLESPLDLIPENIPRLKSSSDLSSESLPSTRSGDMLRRKNFYIFVSLSLGEKALFNLAIDAKRYGTTLVLRGFKAGSYVKTVQALQKIIEKTGQGFIIDPELFTLFAIQTVPTFVLSKPFHLNASERMQTPIHDQIQGHVSAQYVLETFSKEGDLKDEAKSLLLTGETK
jgi:type-F conjugative transfer system pilin assembly protein TrbC